jgi:hypothetical protein
MLSFFQPTLIKENNKAVYLTIVDAAITGKGARTLKQSSRRILPLSSLLATNLDSFSNIFYVFKEYELNLEGKLVVI